MNTLFVHDIKEITITGPVPPEREVSAYTVNIQATTHSGETFSITLFGRPRQSTPPDFSFRSKA